MRRKLFLSILLVVLLPLLFISCVYEPLETDLNTRNIYPISTNTYDIGSLALQYDGGYFREIYLNGVLLVPGILAEVDPVFTASDAFPITAADIANWNALISSQWNNDINGINYIGNVGIHTTSSATGLLTLYSSDGISNDPVLSVGDNSASDESVGIRVNMTGVKTDYTDGIYVTNISTTATAGADKYGIRIKNSGNWLGVGSTNYAFYIETPIGGTLNYSIYSEGGANYLGGTVTLGDVLDMGTHQINNVVDPTLAQDAATKNYVDTVVSGNITGYVPYTGATANVDLNTKSLTLGNNTPIKLTTTSNVTFSALYANTNDNLILNAIAAKVLFLNLGVTANIQAFSSVAGGSRLFILDSLGASAVTPLQDSQYIKQRAWYWNGTVAVSWTFDIYHDMTATTPTSHVDFRIDNADILTIQNNNGTLSINANSNPLIQGSNYHEFTEMAAPGAGAANTVRVYAVEDGGGLTDLAAVFQDGTVDVFAQETTSLTSPIFTNSSGTEVKYVMVKPYPGLVQFVAKFPDGSSFVLRQIEYHDADKIAANTGCEGPLPKGWVITKAAQREAAIDKTAIQHDNTGQGILPKE